MPFYIFFVSSYDPLIIFSEWRRDYQRSLGPKWTKSTVLFTIKSGPVVTEKAASGSTINLLSAKLFC